MPLYLIHKHWARKLHYDLRLQLGGVLKSWAVPKRPSKSPKIKRLAVQVEDHPLAWGSFEGIITEGYGKGKVKIWDKGNYELLEKTKTRLIIDIKGKKLKGAYCLLFFKQPKNWLFFKVKEHSKE